MIERSKGRARERKLEFATRGQPSATAKASPPPARSTVIARRRSFLQRGSLARAFMNSLWSSAKLGMAPLWRLLLYPFLSRAIGVNHVRFDICRSRRFLICAGRRLCASLRTSLRGSAPCMSLSSVSASPWRLASISSTRSFTPKNSKSRSGFNEVTS